MRVCWLTGTLCVATGLLVAGCPSQNNRQEWLEQFSPPPGNEPIDTNPRVAQNLATLSNRLSNGSTSEQTETMTTTSEGGRVTNIEQTVSDWRSEDIYVGGGSFDTNYYNWSEGTGEDPESPSGGGNEPPESRGAHTFAGQVTGTNYEGIVGCCDATWNVRENASLAFNASDELTQIFMPGFALLPDFVLQVGAAGETQVYTGTITSAPPIDWAYHVTTRSVSQSGNSFVVIFDLQIDAASGALDESGTCVHRVEGTQIGDRVQWSSTTAYDVHMLATAPGQPDVSLDTFQNWTLSGSLAQH